MPYSVNVCFEKFRKEVVDLDPEQTKTARASRDFILSNIARLSNEGELPNVLGDFASTLGLLHGTRRFASWMTST